MKRSTLRRSVLAFAGALLVSAPLAGSAGAAPLVDPSPTSHQAAVTAAEQAAVANFWTSERMRSAVPIEDLLRPDQLAKITRSTGAKVERGVPQTVQPTGGTVFGPTANPHGGGPWTGGGAIVKTEGRVFFTYTGRTASCSGTAVTSGNKNTVITAGHCVKLDGAFHTDWVFVPAYDNNNRPYGTWTAKKTYATQQWVASEDINHDVGAAVVNPLNGQNLTDVVGGQGIAFNQARGQNMYAFGYPAAAPYDGTKLIYCSGGTFDAFLSDGIGMTCDMTGGASGGGWFQSFSESTGAGIVNSVNSYKINFIPTWMFGPYFGASAQAVYNTAQAG